jgi:hypothetical protein
LQQCWNPATGQQQQQEQQQHIWQLRPPSIATTKCRCWSKYHALVLRALRQHPELLPRGCRVLLAVSGGQVRM